MSASTGSLASAVPDEVDRRWALTAIAVSIVCLALMAPFARTPLARIPAFISSYEAALWITDLITAALLFTQFARLRYYSILLVASAYLLNTFLVVAHALSFPGVFAESGLFGDSQTTAWLYVFWHAGFPALLLAYAVRANLARDRVRLCRDPMLAIVIAVALVACSAVAMAMLAATGASVLPVLIVAGDFHRLVTLGLSPGIIGISLLAIAVMWKRKRRSILDIWLFAALWVWMCDVTLSAVIGSARYDLGWYGGRLFGLVAASFVLVALLIEMNKLYTQLGDALASAEAQNAELVRSRQELARAQRLEAVGQITGGIAHDFNNLLTAIVGSLEMITRRADDSERVLRLARNALKAADRGTQLIRQLMTFARKHDLRPEVIDPNQTLRDICTLGVGETASNVTLRFGLGETGPVRVDVAEFQAAVLNLVRNAKDAMPDGGTITVSTRRTQIDPKDVTHESMRPGAYVEIAIADTGAGMSAETQAKIFEPFFTTKAVGVGTGLGLSQVYGFAQSASGTVTVESKPGAGSVFTLCLPMSEAAPPAATTKAAAPVPAIVHDQVVLLVDDDRHVLETVKESLLELGYVVETATSAAEALDVLGRDIKVDLLFSDIVMPGGMNGVQLARRAQQSWPALKVVLTSGYAGSALQKFDVPPEFMLIHKPYRRDTLAEKLRSVSAGRAG